MIDYRYLIELNKVMSGCDIWHFIFYLKKGNWKKRGSLWGSLDPPPPPSQASSFSVLSSPEKKKRRDTPYASPSPPLFNQMPQHPEPWPAHASEREGLGIWSDAGAAVRPVRGGTAVASSGRHGEVETERNHNWLCLRRQWVVLREKKKNIVIWKNKKTQWYCETKLKTWWYFNSWTLKFYQIFFLTNN